MATASPGPGPVGYLVNHPAGLAGVHGIGYDYVLGSGGVYVQSESAHLTARVTVAPCDGARARSRGREGGTGPRPHPSATVRAGAALVPGRPGHRAVLRRALGRARLPAGGPTTGGNGHVPGLRATHWGGRRVPLPRKLPRLLLEATDDRDEQGFRIYGVAGRLDTPLPELSLRVGVYGHFAPVGWSQVFDGPDPGLRLMGEEPGETTDINITRR